MRHVRGLDAALADGVDTRLHLILESRDLGRGVVCAHDGVVGRMERRMQGVVDVVDDYVALVAADDALTVIGTQGRGLEYGHAAVGEAPVSESVHAESMRAISSPKHIDAKLSV